MDVDRHVLLSQAGEVERRGHGVRFFVVADVHPTFDGWVRWLIHFEWGSLNGEWKPLPRVEDIQLRTLAICPVAEHVLEEAIKGRRVVVEEIMGE